MEFNPFKESNDVALIEERNNDANTFKPFVNGEQKYGNTFHFNELIECEVPDKSKYENAVPEPKDFDKFELSIAAKYMTKYCVKQFGYKPVYAT